MSWAFTLETFIYLVIGSGIGTIGTFAVQKILEHRLKKKLHRFSKLYSDKIEVIRNLYRLLIRAEKALEIFMSQGEPIDFDKKAEFKKDTLDIINEFINYFEENEIIFDIDSASLVTEIIDMIKKSKEVQNRAKIFESERGSDIWEKAISEKQELLGKVVRIEIPKLKRKLKEEFQKKYQLLTN